MMFFIFTTCNCIRYNPEKVKKVFMTRLFSTTLLLLLLSSAPFFCGAEAARPRAEVLPGPLAAEVLEVLDGDTLTVRVHVWIGQRVETDVRIAGIDTPEIRGQCAREKELAIAARAEVQKLVAAGIVLSNIRLEKYAGRVLAQVETQSGIAIGSHLIAIGLARPYGGEKRAGWCGSASAGK